MFAESYLNQNIHAHMHTFAKSADIFSKQLKICTHMHHVLSLGVIQNVLLQIYVFRTFFKCQENIGIKKYTEK